MKWVKFFFLSMLVFLFSCSGQNRTSISNKNTPTTVGTIVPQLSSSILIVFQATDGKYWFGSDKDGVYSVDGQTIINYSTKDGLCDNRIRSFQEDAKGNIYISTLGGINKFDGSSLTTLPIVKENNWQLNRNDIWFSAVGQNNTKGPYRYDGQTLYQLELPKYHEEEAYFKMFPNNAWSPYDVYYIYKDNNGTMWFGTSNFGVCRYDGKSFGWLYEDHLTNTPDGGSFGIRSILQDNSGKFWFCNSRYRFNIPKDNIVTDEKNLIQYSKEEGIKEIKAADGNDYTYFMSIVEDDNHVLWMATYNNGVWSYDRKQAKHYEVKDGLEKVTIFSIYKDKKGSLWLGTHEKGVYKFNGQAFEPFKP